MPSWKAALFSASAASLASWVSFLAFCNAVLRSRTTYFSVARLISVTCNFCCWSSTCFFAFFKLALVLRRLDCASFSFSVSSYCSYLIALSVFFISVWERASASASLRASRYHSSATKNLLSNLPKDHKTTWVRTKYDSVFMFVKG